MCRADPGERRSQPLVQHRVDVASQPIGIDRGQCAEQGDELGGPGGTSRQGAKLCHLRAIAGDDERLTPLHTREHLTTTVPQVAHGHAPHDRNVSPVRRWWPLVLIRVHAVGDRDLSKTEVDFHRLANTAGHTNPRRQESLRHSRNEVGNEWFLTNRAFLDAIATALGLRTLYSA